MRNWLLISVLVLVAACATTTPSPITYPGSNPVSYGPPGDPGNPEQGPFQPNAELYVCAGSVSNAPPFERDGRITNFNPIIIVNEKVVMSSVPVNDACLSSGFGPRSGRAHKGSDYAPRPKGGQRFVYTAAPGVVREARFESGFGNFVVIDHGNGVFTRYAHLATYEPWVEAGAEIGFGHAIGLMGDSGRASGVHLHFEVLIGNINTPKGAFGLEAKDPLSFPAWSGFAARS